MTNHRHFFHPGRVIPTKCLLCGDPEGWPHVVPSRLWRTGLRRALGTELERPFRPVEVSRATAFDYQLEGRNVLRGLVRAGFATLLSSTGRVAWFRLTVRGIAWISQTPSGSVGSSSKPAANAGAMPE